MTQEGEDRHYASFRNPQSGDPDTIWFNSRDKLDHWVADFKSDHPALSSTVDCYFISAMRYLTKEDF